MTESHPVSEGSARSGLFSGVFKSKMLWLAMMVTVVGGGMWIYASATAPDAGTATGSGANPAALGFSGDSGTGEAAPIQSRLIDDSAPIMFRVGLSFVVGFVIALIAKKFIKTALILAGLVAVGVWWLNRSGMTDVAATVEEQSKHAMEWAQANAGKAKDWVRVYMPSGVSGVVGMFFGARRG